MSLPRLPLLLCTLLGAASGQERLAVSGRVLAPEGVAALESAWVLAVPGGETSVDQQSAWHSVRILWSVPEAAQRVPAGGEFRLELAPGRWFVVAGADGCDATVAEVTLPRAEAPLELRPRLLGVAALRGLLVDAADRPLPGFDLALKLTRGNHILMLQARTDAEGRFELRCAPGPLGVGGQEERWDLDERRARREGGVCARVQAQLEAGKTAEVRLRLLGRAERAGTHVQVLDREGKPVTGAWVALQPGAAKGETWRLLGPDGAPPRGGEVQHADLNARAEQTDAQGLVHLLDEDRTGDWGRERERPAVIVARRGQELGRAELARTRGEVTRVEVKLLERVTSGHARLRLDGFMGLVEWSWQATGGRAGHEGLAIEPVREVFLSDLPPGEKITVWLRATRRRPLTGLEGLTGEYGVGGGAKDPPGPERAPPAGHVACLELEVADGQTLEQTVKLEPARLLEVRLLQPDGQPVQGRVMVSRRPQGALRGHSRPWSLSEDGWLWVPEAFPEEEHELRLPAKVKGQPARRLTVRASEGKQELRLPE